MRRGAGGCGRWVGAAQRLRNRVASLATLGDRMEIMDVVMSGVGRWLMYDVDDYLNVLKDILWSDKLNSLVYTTYQEEITHRTAKMKIIEKEGYMRKRRTLSLVPSALLHEQP